MCAYCGTSFVPHRHNMVYCTKECCSKATNARLIAKYHEEKMKRSQKNRRCTECKNILSKYNSDNVCHSCQIKKSDQDRIQMLKELGFGYESEE